MAATLAVLTGPLRGKRYSVDHGITIGREPGHGISMPRNVGCSRDHAKIHRSGAHDFELVDLASTNGTFVNGVRVERRTLRTGDQIRIGDTDMRFDAG
jgi:pSer/pThr/pTyr-binding forkhead associated (FHA) protein